MSRDIKKQRKRQLEYYYRNRDACIERNKEWRQKNKSNISEYNREYREKNRDRIIEYNKQWKLDNPEKHKEHNRKWVENNREQKRKSDRLYNKTPSGRLRSYKSYTRRDRELGFFPLFNSPFTDDIKVDYHHINNLIVIPIPNRLHEMSVGPNHRKECKEIIKKIYMMDIDKIFSDNVK